MSALGWTPQAGDLVELDAGNRFELPAGRYRLLWHGPRTVKPWELEGITNDARARTAGAYLTGAETTGSLRPIDRSAADKQSEEIRLRLHAPLMGLRSGKHKPQHDASGLDLFRAADEKPLL